LMSGPNLVGMCTLSVRLFPLQLRQWWIAGEKLLPSSVLSIGPRMLLLWRRMLGKGMMLLWQDLVSCKAMYQGLLLLLPVPANCPWLLMRRWRRR
jgi:hypothetical protein